MPRPASPSSKAERHQRRLHISRERRRSVAAGKAKGAKFVLKKSNDDQVKRRTYVSKRRSEKGKTLAWPKAVADARRALGVEGFVAVGGESEAGQALLAKAREFYGGRPAAEPVQRPSRPFRKLSSKEIAVRLRKLRRSAKTSV